MSFIPLHDIRSAAHLPAQDLHPTLDQRRRLPPWFKVKIRQGPDYKDIRHTMDRLGLHTICEEGRCPNLWECWNARTATFLILGDICTRRCHYCAVTTGRPQAVDPEEPRRVAEAVQALGLRHAVITSVNRDELADGGAAVFADTIRLTRERNPGCTVEVLIPDFEGNAAALEAVCRERPDVLNHNIETVPRLFPALRPQGKYQRSLELLARAHARGLRTKSARCYRIYVLPDVTSSRSVNTCSRRKGMCRSFAIMSRPSSRASKPRP